MKIGDTTNANHSEIDRIADFHGITWVDFNYNSSFGGQWCFIDSIIVDNSGPYAMQRVMSCENAAILATRYCTKGTWGAWNVGVTKSDLNNVSNKLMLDGMKTLSVKWTNSDTLEFYVDNTRVFGILAKWGGNYS